MPVTHRQKCALTQDLSAEEDAQLLRLGEDYLGWPYWNMQKCFGLVQTQKCWALSSVAN